MRIGIFKNFFQKVGDLITGTKIDEELFEQLEELLLAADVNIHTVEKVLNDLRALVQQDRIFSVEEVQKRLKEALLGCFVDDQICALKISDSKPTVYLFVGVNGVGKTTTIGKLAHRYIQSGKQVVLAAGDTFRAAASDQLEIWSKRTGAELVKAKEGADPSSVIFDAINSARSRGADYVLADTAGRQHSNRNLMEELKKVARVTEKALGRSADETLLVLDAVTGQNAIRQADEFLKAVNVTGIALAKLDGSSRGGAVIAIRQMLKLPVKLVGVGEKAEDLRDFHPQDFVNDLF